MNAQDLLRLADDELILGWRNSEWTGIAPFLEEDVHGRRPRGRRLRYAVGELLNCTRCMGAWSALALVALRLHSPAAGRTATTVLAASGGSDVLHSAFSLLCARATAAQAADDPKPVSAARRAAA